MWDVEYTDVFGEWWNGLTVEEQSSVSRGVYLLEQVGPELPFPHSSQVKGSRYRRMRELRVQHAGKPYRVLYALDPRRSVILLLGGSKAGNDRWYTTNIPRADDLYRDHLAQLELEGVNDGKKILGIAREDAARGSGSLAGTSGENPRRNGPRRNAPRAWHVPGRAGKFAEREAAEHRQARAANGHVYLHAA
jgi:hypothetical protein